MVNPRFILAGVIIGCPIGTILYSYYENYRKEKDMFKLAALPTNKYQYYNHKFKKIIEMIYKEENNPTVVNIEMKNEDCLIKRGYTTKMTLCPSFYRRGNYTTLYKVSKKDNSDVDIDVFLIDCRSCNVHTEITYIADIVSSKYVYKTQCLPWDKKYVNEEEAD